MPNPYIESLDCRRVYFQSWIRFSGTGQEYALFTPVAELRSEIERVIGPFSSGRTIGVHIRRTDHKIATERSSLDGFREAIEGEIRTDPSTRFYLATDDLAVQADLMTSYPGRLIVRQKNLSRDSEDGVRDAVIDLWILSRTAKILGSAGSSFSHTAAELGGIAEHTVGMK